MTRTGANPEVVNVYEAKTQLSKLLNRVADGEEVVIGRSGKPIARLVPYTGSIQRREFGRLAGTIRMSDDFDDTPPWLLDAFEGTGGESGDEGDASAIG